MFHVDVDKTMSTGFTNNEILLSTSWHVPRGDPAVAVLSSGIQTGQTPTAGRRCFWTCGIFVVSAMSMIGKTFEKRKSWGKLDQRKSFRTMEWKFEWGLTKRWDREDKGLTHEWNLCGVANHLCTNQGILEWDEEFPPRNQTGNIFDENVPERDFCGVDSSQVEGDEEVWAGIHLDLAHLGERDALIEWRKRGFWEHCTGRGKDGIRLHTVYSL